MDHFLEHNRVVLQGTLSGNFIFSHEMYGERFFMIDLEIPRLSGKEDVIPLLVSEHLIDEHVNYDRKNVAVLGQFRSYNQHVGGKTRLVLTVFVREWELMEEVIIDRMSNYIELEGFICKEPVYRKTPLGREIADILLAVNRSYGKSDYIPCISWGRNARYINKYEVGELCRIVGRIQSREYRKKISEDVIESRIAYEVSVTELVLEHNGNRVASV